jgi:type II secretory pathway pseudopilin PulG
LTSFVVTFSMLLRAKNVSGMSLVEVLGATTLLMALASVAVISTKDSLKAGQRSTVQRELQSLNTALNNFKAAGGTIAPDADARKAVQAMRYGVGISDMESYAPLTEDPDWSKTVGDETYNLLYDDTQGFTYAADLLPPKKGTPQTSEGKPTGGYGFDISDKDAALAALAALATLNPEDPAYGSSLEALNAAYALGTLTEQDMLAAGLVKYGNEWMSPEAALLNLAEDARTSLEAGSSWSSLPPEMRGAFANTYPSEAVRVGGAEALNIMDQARLTPELVSGYAKVGTTWLAPSAVSQGTASKLVDSVGAPTGSGSYKVYAVTDPLAPAVHVGTLMDLPQIYQGIFIDNYYSYQQEYDTSGGNPWEGGLPWVELSKPTYRYTSTGSTVTDITSLVGSTTQIIYVKN